MIPARVRGHCTVCLVYGVLYGLVLSVWRGMGARPLPGALTPRRGRLAAGMAMAMANRRRSSLRFIIAVKDAGIRAAAASSSKNAKLFLRKLRLDVFAQHRGITSASLRRGLTLLDFFDAGVSGRDFAHRKPDPEMFLTAATELGVAPHAAMVIEDAAAGVQAAKAGDMAAIGIARAHDAGLLGAAGAGIVVTTLDEVDRSAMAHRRLATKIAYRAGRCAVGARRPDLVPVDGPVTHAPLRPTRSLSPRRGPVALRVNECRSCRGAPSSPARRPW
jgi:HAD superfamily hydrolase (TIGR01509 family)